MRNKTEYIRNLKRLDMLLRENYNLYKLFKRIYESDKNNKSTKSKDEIRMDDPEILDLLDMSSVDIIDILNRKKCNFDYMALPDSLEGKTIAISNLNELIDAIHILLEQLR